MGEPNIEQYVDLAMQNIGLVKYTSRVKPKDKSEGHLSEVTFVSVTGVTENGESKSFELAIKTGKTSESLRRQLPLRDAYVKECYVYETVRKTFQQFEREKGLEGRLTFMPNCYATTCEDNNEATVLENLRPQGFGLWDKTVPMTVKHVSLVLEAYGHWHALSVALKTQQRVVFEKLVENNVNLFSKQLAALKLDVVTAEGFLETREKIAADIEPEFLEMLNFSKDDILYTLKEMFHEEPDHQVILHGDCWNSNFLFNTPENPSEVRIVDWQMSMLASPIFDLCYFIFSCFDTEKHQDVTQLLDIYHKSFSKHLTSYGCDPEEVFSYSKILQHWKRFSRFGLILSCMIIKICLNHDQVVDLNDVAENGDDISENFVVSNSRENVYLKRVKSNILFYCNSLKLPY